MKSYFILNDVQKDILRALKDAHDLTLRQLDADDGERLARFYDGLSPASQEFFTPHRFDAVSLKRIVRDFVYSGKHEAFLVTDTRGDIVAYFFLWNIDFPTPVLSIAVADPWQKKGIGTKLIRFLIEEARVQGKTAIELTVHIENSDAFRLYQKLGFQFAGMAERPGKNGRTVPQKELFFRF